jgi:hypothetical protein
LRGFWAGYFASRAAPLGRASAATVSATFYGFHPAMVERAVPGCWDVIAPETLCAVRASAAAEALADLCSTGARTALVAAMPLLRRAVEDADGAGRVLAGANRSLWRRSRLQPAGDGMAEAWQACTALREHRGDGHVAALVTAGVGGLASHLLASGSTGVAPEVLRDNRGWSVEDWELGVAALAGHGLLHDDGRATDAGRTVHASVEARTDLLAEPPYEALSDAAAADLHGALAACAREIAASGVLPYPNPMGLPHA